jgi:sigma-B regulation protein RsbU (phosphoserine phosphatase)
MSETRHPEAADYQGAFALLAEMSQDFAGASDLQATLERAITSIAAQVGAEVGSLWLVEGSGRDVACLASVGPNPITGMRLSMNEGIVGRSVRENICQTVLDARRDPHFSARADQESDLTTRSLMIAPMSLSDDVLGAVQLVNKRTEDGCFSEADAHLLQVLASSAGLAIANARLTAAQVENERVRRELELAAEIQRNLLPAARPSGFPVHGLNIPARRVSGDFFDILPFGSDRIAFCLGDVSGKGMNAALLMAKTASLYRLLARDAVHPGALLARLNDEICDTSARGMFVTMVAGTYDTRRGRICIANAGHEPPLYRHPHGRLESHPAEAPPLGILEGRVYPESAIEMRGGCLYLCSDGLTEAPSDGAQLGQQGLRRLVERLGAKPLDERIEAIAAAVGASELRDDLTLLGVSDASRDTA